jgi:hypothetical protein
LRTAIFQSSLLLLLCLAPAQGHDIITTPITWSREISRIVYARCASCHHDGGSAFSLMTYAEVRPWVAAIKEETLTRRMPPWGAVKGFGDFRDDQALTPEQLELITSWADGGVPEGDPKDLPPKPKIVSPTPARHQPGELIVSKDYTLRRPFRLGGLWLETTRDLASFQITAELPDGSVEPLLWLQDYRTKFAHPFYLRTPLDLPASTVIRGVPSGVSVVLTRAHRSGPYSPPRSAGTEPKPGKSALAGKQY